MFTLAHRWLELSADGFPVIAAIAGLGLLAGMLRARTGSLAPGIIDTPMLAGVNEEFRATLAEGIPFPKRLGHPDEYARLAMMIIEHDYLNGEVIRMDGALRMAPR